LKGSAQFANIFSKQKDRKENENNEIVIDSIYIAQIVKLCILGSFIL